MKNNKNVMKEFDIRPEQFQGRLNELQIIDASRLLSKYGDFVSVLCPACNADTPEYFFTKYGLKYNVCKVCETIYISPRPSLEVLEFFYKGSPNYNYWNDHIFPATEATRRKELFEPRAKAITKVIENLIPEADSLIEIGAAQGYFIDEILKLKRFSKVVAVEATSSLAKTLLKKGVEVIESLAEDIDSDYDNQFDVLVCFEVIEHLFSPKDFLDRCKMLLKDKGILFLTCPNGQGFDNLLLGQESSTFDYEHLNYFNPKSIEKLIKNAGFEVQSIDTPGKLDVDLVKKAFDEGRIDLRDNVFIKTIFSYQDNDKLNKLQEFLSKNMLSGHLQVIAVKNDNKY